MKITKMRIENIKGIGYQNFSFEILPNVPTVMVAPNGFGKTSLATAFSSLRQKDIKLSKNDFYQNDKNNEPLLEITDDKGNIYKANSNFNTISNTFSVFVIRNPLRAKGLTRKFGGRQTSEAYLQVEPIVIYKKVPEKFEWDYSITKMKESVQGSAGKLLINLSDFIYQLYFIRDLKKCENEFRKLSRSERYNNNIEAFKEDINSACTTKDQIASYKSRVSIEKVKPLAYIKKTFEKYWVNATENKLYLNAIQLLELYLCNKSNFNNIIKYYEYKKEHRELNKILSNSYHGWKNIKAVTKKNKLVVEFPRANNMSNGERDILWFISNLVLARRKLRKNKAILILDEIFDYYDDANLISAQYFLTNFIDQYKSSNRELFTFILTHLDPYLFRSYQFSNTQIRHLKKFSSKKNTYGINNLIKKRNDCKRKHEDIYDFVSSNYLHYSIETASNNRVEQYLDELGVKMQLKTPKSFRNIVSDELTRYVDEKNYDAILVCCGLRIHIEKSAYDQLHENHKSKFLSECKLTNEKLSYAQERGAKIPEVHFLLSTVYNAAMHLDDHCNELNSISHMLNNKTIHQMIKEAINTESP